MGKRLLSYMEYHAFKRRLTPCAEFPNDNQDLHHGAIWLGGELGREPVCELPPARVLAAAVEAKPLEPAIGLALSASLPAGSTEPIVSLLTIDERPGDSSAQFASLPTIDEGEEREPGTAPAFLASAEPAPASATWDSPESDLEASVVADDLEENLLAQGADFEESLLAEDADPIEIVDELSFDDSLDDLPIVFRATEPVSVRAPAELVTEQTLAELASESAGRVDAFAQLVASLEDVARALGAGDETVTCLDALFGQARMEAVAPGDHIVEALIAGGVVARGSRGLVRSGPFAAKVHAWQGILRGESEDFSLADGGALEPLDEWAADLLARVVGPPARAEGIRRDLRRRGIAAFGLVAKAA
jgi:hypothetical protein